MCSHQQSPPPSHPAFMDSIYIDSSTEHSRQSRSRANSHLSSTALQLQGLNIFESPISTPHLGPVDIPGTSQPAYLDHNTKSSAPSTLFSPTPQGLTPFPLLSDIDLDADWAQLDSGGQSATATTPSLVLDPAQSSSSHSSVTEHHHLPLLRSNSFPANMR